MKKAFVTSTGGIAKLIFLASSLFLVSLFSLSASAALNEVEKTKVITVTAQQLTNINAYRLDAYSLMRVKAGGLEPIPYQFDEMTKDGFVYIEGANSFALTFEGVKSHLKGKQHFFDEDDELLFMMRDAGSRWTGGKSPDAEMLSEIAIRHNDGTYQYVYVVRAAKVSSDAFYVRYSSRIGRVETDYYSLMVDQKNALVWNDFLFDSYAGANFKKPFDTMKLGMSGHVLSAGALPIYLTNKSLKAKALAQKVGPIRATATFRLTLKFLGIPWFVSKLQIRHYESKVGYDFIMRMPELRRQYVGNLRLKMTMDGRDLDGADVLFSKNPDELAKADGEISELEASLMKSELNILDENWIWLDTHDDFSTLMSYKVEHTTKFNSRVNTPRIRYNYEDRRGKKQKHEFHAGQIPDAGFEIKLPQMGRIKIGYMYDMFAKEHKKAAKEVVADIVRVPEVSVKNMKSF